MLLAVASVLLALSPLGAKAEPDWSGEVLYFVLVDRFADGDNTNNKLVERNNPGGYHGGDIKGLTEHLDEIAELGATAIWISPLQKQMGKPVYAQAPAKLGLPEFQHWGFHGYWIADFDALEPQFGTVDDLKNLVDAAHRRGIKVLLDVVYNHPGYASKYQDFKTRDGETWLRQGDGNCEINPITCRVGGLPDFRTELPEIREYLLKANIDLAKRSGVDGFRLDTYKHVESSFWQEHRKRTRAQLGENFFLLAEYWGGTASSLDPFFERDEVDAGFDFSFKGSCEAFVQGRGRAVAYGNYLRSRHRVRPGYLLAHYMSSHDEPMALGDLEGDKSRFRVCAAIQMVSLGMPVIYYGEEVARGGHEWPLNRNDMPWGERDILPGKGKARDESLHAYYKTLIAVRKQHPALQRGDFLLLTQAQDPLLAFSRRDPASADQVLVLVNRNDEARSVDMPLPEEMAAAALTDRLSGQALTTADGRLKLEMPPKSVRIITMDQTKAPR